ncbi:hypothetical protein PIB30_014142 [Stylosanthes scabra]|uniref:Uncharacterized protein n=1 Tax=Stylosanthes scabra TaxID=79078 RepID=A0ABU6U6H7_9FABA|nr:hypothetical protein [Stylosanthes scabra]
MEAPTSKNQETHQRQNWITEEDSSPNECSMLEEMNHLNPEQPLNVKGKPPDPENKEETNEANMKIDIQKEVDKLIEGVYFTTPNLHEVNTAETDDMQLI